MNGVLVSDSDPPAEDCSMDSIQHKQTSTRPVTRHVETMSKTRRHRSVMEHNLKLL
jgi:hypothetical protein